ncbi:MAG: membrane protein insertase YidC, partial [Bacteroidales bacterium]|nr:membrane protein insertase YidC [Bacteroidales bacterium]
TTGVSRSVLPMRADTAAAPGAPASISGDCTVAADGSSLPSEPVSSIPNIYRDSLLNLSFAGSPEIIALENDRIALEFTTRGAQPLSVRVKDYYNYDSTELYLFRPGQYQNEIKVYAGEAINTADFCFEVAEKTDTSLVMRLPFAGGGYIQRRYALKEGSYMMTDELSFVDMGGVIPPNVSSFDIDYSMTVPRMEKGYKNESQYSKLDFYYDGDKKPVEIGRGRNAEKQIDNKLHWFAFQQQFFSAIFTAQDRYASGSVGISFCPEDDPERNLMNCTARMRVELAAGGNAVVPFECYFGPNHFQTLNSYGRKYEKIIPLGGWLVGWFTRYAIIPMFNFFHRFIDNFGLIILLMTIVIKIVVFPLTYKSFASSAKMQALRPEMDKINAKFPNTGNQQDQLKKQQAQMELYKRAGVSPMGGCLPTLLTFPILWAMFRFFPASIELRQQPFLWCHDLSAYDSIIEYGTRVPIFGDHLSLFALLMAVTMWVYSKMTLKSQPNAGDPTAKSMNFMSLWMMPIMMFFICNSLSAALSYYYLLSQFVAIIQTWAIRKSIDPQKILDRVHASEGKPLPKSKWQLRLEEAQKMQRQQQAMQQKRNGRR